MHFQFSQISEVKNYILTAFLLVISVTLLVSRQKGGVDNLRTASITLFSYIQEPLSKIKIYRQALKTNSYLRKQNILLRDKLNRLQSAKHRNKKLRSLLNFDRSSNLHLYPVRIVGKELHQANNVLTINAGSHEGLKQGMPLISAKGLVGKIILTASEYAEVMPYFNTLFKVSAKLQNSDAYGIVSWDGKNSNELVLKYIPQTIPVNIGEAVLTSGYSQKIPPNICIGKVVRHESNKGRGMQRIYIRPAANLYTLAAGFVVTGTTDTTKKRLKQKYQHLFK
jgi:rod shape-determining protein MreC